MIIGQHIRVAYTCIAIIAVLPAAVAGGASSPPRAATHWAFRPPVRPPVPVVKAVDRVRTDVDRFILAALERRGVALNPQADRATLIRRVAFDLTGLPPTLDEIDAFRRDSSPRAAERMIDRYLASPHYGERWGRHWLDAAGYADSNGYFHADTDRPLAYKYRDYVVRAINADKPFDRFLHEQIAGDELAGYAPDGDVTPAMAELLTATHFLRNGPDGTGESDGNDQERQTDRIRVIESATEMTASALLGLTLRCARCHDHKFDPISQTEYFAMQAILSPAYTAHPDRWLEPNRRVVTVGTRGEREAHRRATERADRPIDALRKSVREFAGPIREVLVDERIELLDPPVRAALDRARKTPSKQRTDEQKTLLANHKSVLEVSDDDLGKRFPEFATLRRSVDKRIRSLEKNRPAPLPKVAALFETHRDPLDHHLLERGVHTAPGPVVAPIVPASLTTPSNRYRISPRPAGRISSGRRTAFARWLTDRDNPLVARVMANRIWQRHFGRGIVTTPGNFGVRGARPTHPELLDYLATEFMRRGWSLKDMHRLILTSAVYRQTGTHRERAASVDADNTLLWRFPTRRLDAESVRDAMLSVSGQLDRRMGGPYIPTHRSRDGRVTVDAKKPGARRRSIHLQQRRTQVATMLEVFDAPGMVRNCLERPVSTIPLQSLALLNSDFAVTAAHAFARRVLTEASATDTAGIKHAFLLAVGRPPHDDERAAARQFLNTQRKNYLNRDDATIRVWSDLCQMIFASNAFLYVD